MLADLAAHVASVLLISPRHSVGAAMEARRTGARRFQNADGFRGDSRARPQGVGTQESTMKALMIATTVTVLTAAPLFAQERDGQDPRGYAAALGGFATSLGTTGNTTGDLRFEGGVRVGPHVMVVANGGRFADLQPDLQPTLASATASLANQGIIVTGGGTLRAWYGTGGVRAEIPAGSRVFPYLLATAGVARLNPGPTFIYSSGILPDGSVEVVGADVTPILTASGLVAAQTPSTAPMFTLGGGVQIPVVPHVALDAGYRYSRINADTTLNALPVNANGLTFGIAYRF
jgi:opacity protein-like surface antigen